MGYPKGSDPCVPECRSEKEKKNSYIPIGSYLKQCLGLWQYWISNTQRKGNKNSVRDYPMNFLIEFGLNKLSSSWDKLLIYCLIWSCVESLAYDQNHCRIMMHAKGNLV